MSFSIGIQAKVDEDLGAAIDRAVAEDIERGHANNYVPNSEAARDLGMIEIAKAAVSAAADTIARPGDGLSISLSGHANPSGEPKPGWASNSLTVSVTQIYPTESA